MHTGTEGENRGHTLKLNDSPKPFVLEKTFVKCFFLWLVHSHEARGIEGHEVGVSNEGGGLAMVCHSLSEIVSPFSQWI